MHKTSADEKRKPWSWPGMLMRLRKRQRPCLRPGRRPGPWKTGQPAYRLKKRPLRELPGWKISPYG